MREKEKVEIERRRQAEAFQHKTTPEQTRRIEELTTDFAAVWSAPTIGNAERKRMLALMVEDVTLTRAGHSVSVQLRMRGGKAVELEPVKLHRPGDRVAKTPSATVAEVARLTSDMPDKAIAEELNRRGFMTCHGKPLTGQSIASLRHYHGLSSHLQLRQQALHDQGWSTAGEISATLGIGVRALRARSYRGTWVERKTFTIGQRSFSMYRLSCANRPG